MKRRRRIVFGIVIAALLAMGGGWYYYSYHTMPEFNSSVTEEWSQAVIDDNRGNIDKSVNTIRDIRRHEDVPEYQYILTRYYATQLDIDKAKRYADLFRSSASEQFRGGLNGMTRDDALRQLEIDISDAEDLKRARDRNNSRPKENL